MKTTQDIRGLVDISGFGGGYERTCQNMLQAGFEWLQKNEEVYLNMNTFQGVYGVLETNSLDAKELSKVIIEASGNDCTGAMHQAVMTHLYRIHKWGIDKWKKDIKK